MLPMGLYPQLRLCGHDGKAPISIRIKIISKIVPTDMIALRLEKLKTVIKRRGFKRCGASAPSPLQQSNTPPRNNLKTVA